MYSSNVPVTNRGPAKFKLEKLKQWTENDYACRNKYPVKGCKVRLKLRCYDQMETHYYTKKGM